MDLVIESREAEGLLIIDVKGELDVYTAPQLGQAVAENVAQGHRDFVLDLSQVTFMDSTALGVLVSSRQKVAEGEGRLRLVLSNPYLGKIMRITGLEDLFEIFSTLEDAVGSAAPAA